MVNPDEKEKIYYIRDQEIKLYLLSCKAASESQNYRKSMKEIELENSEAIFEFMILMIFFMKMTFICLETLIFESIWFKLP